MAIPEFIAKWRKVELKERSAALAVCAAPGILIKIIGWA